MAHVVLAAGLGFMAFDSARGLKPSGTLRERFFHVGSYTSSLGWKASVVADKVAKLAGAGAFVKMAMTVWVTPAIAKLSFSAMVAAAVTPTALPWIVTAFLCGSLASALYRQYPR